MIAVFFAKRTAISARFLTTAAGCACTARYERHGGRRAKPQASFEPKRAWKLACGFARRPNCPQFFAR
jgi:hypothetical protein